MKKISRRSFLKVSGTMAAAGALAACGGSSSTSTAASSEAAPSVEAKAVDGLPDMSKETLNFSSDKVGSGSYNMIVAMSKVLEKAGGFQTVNVNPDSPGGMGAPYLFASGNTDLAFINGAPAKWAMEEGTLGKPATSGYHRRPDCCLLHQLRVQRIPAEVQCLHHRGDLRAEAAPAHRLLRKGLHGC